MEEIDKWFIDLSQEDKQKLRGISKKLSRSKDYYKKFCFLNKIKKWAK